MWSSVRLVTAEGRRRETLAANGDWVQRGKEAENDWRKTEWEICSILINTQECYVILRVRKKDKYQLKDGGPYSLIVV